MRSHSCFSLNISLIAFAFLLYLHMNMSPGIISFSHPCFKVDHQLHSGLCHCSLNVYMLCWIRLSHIYVTSPFGRGACVVEISSRNICTFSADATPRDRCASYREVYPLYSTSGPAVWVKSSLMCFQFMYCIVVILSFSHYCFSLGEVLKIHEVIAMLGSAA